MALSCIRPDIEDICKKSGTRFPLNELLIYKIICSVLRMELMNSKIKLKLVLTLLNKIFKF